MNSAEHADLLDHIREQMRAHGFADLDQEILAAVASGESDESSPLALGYLEHFKTLLRLRSGAAAAQALEGLRQFAGVGDMRLNGLQLIFTEPHDRQLYGGDAVVDLTEPRLTLPDGLMDDLDNLIVDMRREVAPPELGGETYDPFDL